MKKWLFTFVILLLFCSVAYAEPPTIFINGKQLVTDNPPVIEDGRTLIPMRALFESLGKSVTWNNDNQSISSGNILLKLNSTIAFVGDKTVTLDVPAKLINEKTYVPLRFIAESLGATVNYDKNFNRIKITNSNNGDTNNKTIYGIELLNNKELLDSLIKKFDGVRSNNISSLVDMSSELSYLSLDDRYLVLQSALSEVKNTDEYKQVIDLSNKIKNDILSLNNPPSEFKDSYDCLVLYYNSYIQYRDLVMYPINSSEYMDEVSDKRLELTAINDLFVLI